MRSGGTPNTSIAAYYNGGIPWVSITDMTHVGKVITKTERTLSEEGLAQSAAQMFPAGTLLYAMYASIGECSLAGVPVCSSQAILGIQTHSSLDTEYLYYWLTSQKDGIKTRGQQGTQANLNKAIVQDLVLPLPEVREQQAIAEALSDVDELLGALEAMIAKKRAIKQAAMQQLLTGKTRLPGFSGEWETKQLGELGRFGGGTGFPTAAQGVTSGDYPFFKVSDMNNDGNGTFMKVANNYVSDEVRKALGATAFPANSIVFAKVGAAVFLERKKVLSQPSCLDNNMAAFVLDHGAADYRFIHLVFLNTTLGDLVSTTALPSLNSSILSSIECRLPPIEEQTAIATVVSDLDAEIVALEARRDKTHQIKQGMMQQLLTGRVRLVKPEAAA